MDIFGQEKPSLGYVAHFGVKGMKWGVRKNRNTSRMSRKDLKAKNKADREKFNQEKIQRVISTASKKPDSTISLKTQSLTPVLVTGEQFTSYLANRGVFDVRNPKMNEQFKKTKR
jgi:hypothetical protein